MDEVKAMAALIDQLEQHFALAASNKTRSTTAEDGSAVHSVASAINDLIDAKLAALQVNTGDRNG